MSEPKKTSASKSIVVFAATFLVAILCILVAPYIIGHYFQYQNEKYAERAMSKIPDSAFEKQKEFTRNYTLWMMKYCIHNNWNRRINKEQLVDFCACYMKEKITHLTMAEQSKGVSVNWEYKNLPPELQKKRDAFDATCLVEALK